MVKSAKGSGQQGPGVEGGDHMTRRGKVLGGTGALVALGAAAGWVWAASPTPPLRQTSSSSAAPREAPKSG
jgi:hypothetical protein